MSINQVCLYFINYYTPEQKWSEHSSFSGEDCNQQKTNLLHAAYYEELTTEKDNEIKAVSNEFKDVEVVSDIYWKLRLWIRLWMFYKIFLAEIFINRYLKIESRINYFKSEW